MKTARWGIAERILVPVTTVFFVSMLTLVSYAWIATQRGTVAACEANAIANLDQFKTLRTYYTENVVKKVKAGSQMRISFDHATQTNTIPLPATLIHDLSDLMGRETNGVRLKLYSSYPFPNHQARVPDEFMKEALNYFSTHTNGTFVKVTPADGRPSVRVAIADTMSNVSCVDCHNTHPDSPKKDWKLGDVRGVLEVDSPIDAQLAHSKTMMARMLLLTVVLGMALIGLMAWYINRWIARPIFRAVAALEEVGEQVAGSSGQVAATSQSLAGGASEQAASLQETSASLEEMLSMTERNAENALTAKALSAQTRAAADNGAADVEAMSQAMGAIKTSSDNIAKIIKTIDEIAFQTNILALNAAVEAARAGAAGMGFAVVADEVRNLAQRSAQAARETADKIEDSIGKSSHGVQISVKVAAGLREIVTKAHQVDELIAEIANASLEQSQGINQVNIAVSQMDKVTQGNAAAAEESAGASEELNSQAAALNETVAELSHLVGGVRGEDKTPPPPAHGHSKSLRSRIGSESLTRSLRPGNKTHSRGTSAASGPGPRPNGRS